MVSRTRLKSLLTGLALYAVAAMMVGYFGVNAYTGKYGLNARQELDQEIIALTSELARLKRERAEGEQRVSLLRSDRVDPDMLDERVRYQLDYADPRELVRTTSRTANAYGAYIHAVILRGRALLRRPGSTGDGGKFQNLAYSIPKISPRCTAA